MLVKFAVTNYRGFAQRIEWDLSKPSNYSFNTFAIKNGIKECKELFSLDNCQVFTSSHNTYLMTNDLLRPDCNFIINDNKIKPLTECTNKELRFGHNIEKLFRGKVFKV